MNIENIINIVHNINRKTFLGDTSCKDEDTDEEDYNNTEMDNLIESTCYIIDDVINHNPLELGNPKFEIELKRHVEDVLYEQLKEIYEMENLFSLIENIYNKSYSIYFPNIMPPRSYDTTFIRKIPNVENMTKKIEHVRN